MDLLTDFIGELRKAGISVSLTESLDAHNALVAQGISDREYFRESLATTLVKNSSHRVAFDTAFDVYFGLRSVDGMNDEQNEGSKGVEGARGVKSQGKGKGGGGGGEGVDPEELAEMLFNSLLTNDNLMMRNVAGLAVTLYAGMEPGRPVGGTYYLYRTLRNLGLESLQIRLKEKLKDNDETPFNDRLANDEAKVRLEKFKNVIEEEIRRRLIEDRGTVAMARTLRKPLPEDIDVMHASREEMVLLKLAIRPLARKLASRLAEKRRHKKKGTLDFRKTIRESLALGGVPAEPRFKKPRQAKPDIVVLADISGSVASFARFTLQLVHALAGQFSKVRSFVFIDGIDEVTEYFEKASDVTEALYKINTEAKVMWLDGHSDYGHAFMEFYNRWPGAVNSRTSLLILGDARNNYHASQDWVLEALKKKAKHVFWLNPEPTSYWSSGDSIIDEYAKHVDGVFEVRTLRQLETFVSRLD